MKNSTRNTRNTTPATSTSANVSKADVMLSIVTAQRELHGQLKTAVQVRWLGDARPTDEDKDTMRKHGLRFYADRDGACWASFKLTLEDVKALVVKEMHYDLPADDEVVKQAASRTTSKKSSKAPKTTSKKSSTKTSKPTSKKSDAVRTVVVEPVLTQEEINLLCRFTPEQRALLMALAVAVK